MPTWRLRLRLAGARQHEIAEAAQTGERVAAAAFGHRQPRDLHEPARDQRRHRVVPEPGALDDAGGNRDDVLQRAADLDADHVVARIEPEARGRGTSAARSPRRPGRSSGEHRRRQPARDFRAQSSGPTARRPARVSSVSSREHLRHARERFRLEPLRRADQHRVAAPPAAPPRARTARRPCDGSAKTTNAAPSSARSQLRRAAHRRRQRRTPAGSARCAASARSPATSAGSPRPQADLVADPRRGARRARCPSCRRPSNGDIRRLRSPRHAPAHPALGARRAGGGCCRDGGTGSARRCRPRR